MFFWNSLAFSRIQQMLAIWPLVRLLFLNPAWISGTSQFRYCSNLAWRNLTVTLQRVRWVQLCGSLSILWHCHCQPTWIFHWLPSNTNIHYPRTWNIWQALTKFSKCEHVISDEEIKLGENWIKCALTWVRASDGKASAYNAGDPGLIPALGRSSGEGNGNPFQYSCLENPMDRGAW